MLGRLLTAALALSVCACGSADVVPVDGGGNAPPDAPSADGPEPLALDFTMTGCTRYDSGAARCFGSPPLALSFSPVSSPSFTRFLWSFGDGSPDSSERAPRHTFALPRTYDVTLVGAGSMGTASSTQHVSVTVLEAGSPCDVDAQCATGLTCRCGAGAGCGAAFARGLCTAPCVGGACGAGAVCATILTAGGGGGDGGAADAGDGGADAGGAPSSAREPLCFAACQQDVDCATGLRCRDLPGGGAGQPRWARACFPDAAADVGQPCRDPNGALSGPACVSGLCADLGALGLCSAACGAAGPCPSGSACAELGDGRALCLRVCADFADCTRDPLLACLLPGTGGALGFSVPDGTAGATYCAPRFCSDDTDCAPAGVCDTGHCVKAPQ